jgi:hypothetical protein
VAFPGVAFIWFIFCFAKLALTSLHPLFNECLTQEIVGSKEGENIFNQVVIDAADPKKVKNGKWKAYITY